MQRFKGYNLLLSRLTKVGSRFELDAKPICVMSIGLFYQLCNDRSALQHITEKTKAARLASWNNGGVGYSNDAHRLGEQLLRFASCTMVPRFGGGGIVYSSNIVS